MYLLNKGDSINSLSGATNVRNFDLNTNSATLAMAAVSLNAAMDPVSFQLDMGWGSAGAIINSVNNNPFGQGNFIVLQGYASIALPGKLTIDFGKFYTTAGAEVIQANKNWLYSRSFLFFNIPLLHTGARANLKVNDQLALQASVVNGWNDDPDVNAWKTVGFSAAFTPNQMVALTGTTYIGKEAAQVDAAGMPLPSTPGDVRILVDIVAALTFSDKLGVNFNFDYVKGNTNVAADYFVGGAAMARFVVNSNLNLAARGEFGRTHVASANQDYMGGTLGIGLPVGKNFQLQPEFRIDHFGQSAVFTSNNRSDQITGTLAAMAWF
jgi:hypothetical protein